jgi:hypothetical protein
MPSASATTSDGASKGYGEFDTPPKRPW